MTQVGASPTVVSGAPGPAVKLDEVRFAYGTHVILDGIDLEVSEGSITGIVGPSGCGKSTLLATIAGLLAPTSGSIVRYVAANRHPVSMVFQKDTLLPWMTVIENVLAYTKYQGHRARARAKRQSRRGHGAPDDVRARAEDLLALAGLADHADKYPYQLSGGMRRRLAFVVAVVVEPGLLLLDEPFSSVDEPTRIGIHQDVFDIAKRMRMTTVLVTHDLAEAVSLCDKVFVLSRSPSRVARTHSVDLGDDRRMLEIRESPDYSRAYADLWHDLSEQIVAGPRSEGEK